MSFPLGERWLWGKFEGVILMPFRRIEGCFWSEIKDLILMTFVRDLLINHVLVTSSNQLV